MERVLIGLGEAAAGRPQQGHRERTDIGLLVHAEYHSKAVKMAREGLQKRLPGYSVLGISFTGPTSMQALVVAKAGPAAVHGTAMGMRVPRRGTGQF